jgi:hypothetical protein
MHGLARIVSWFAKALVLIVVFFIDVKIVNSNLETTTARAYETTRSGMSNTTQPAGKVILTAEEQKNGGVLSPFEACKGFVLVPTSDFQKAYWQERQNGHCDPKTSNCQLKVQVIPDRNMFGQFEGKSGVNMSGSITATAFLESVRLDAIQQIEAQIRNRETLLGACRGPDSSVNCKSFDKIKGQLAKNEGRFRNAVALLTEPSDSDLMRVIVTGDVGPLINRGLRIGSGPIRTMVNVPQMVPLSEIELDAAKSELTKILVAAKEEWASDVEATIKKRLQSGMPHSQIEQSRKNLMKEENFRVKLRRSILDMQAKKIEIYDQIVKESPEMPFLGKSSPNVSELIASQNLIIANLKAARSAMDKSLRPEDLKSEKKLNEVLQYASLKNVIEAKLERENQAGQASSCAVATAVNLRLKETQDRHRALLGMAALGGAAVGGAAGLGLLGVGAVGTGTAIAFASGIIGSASGMLHESGIKQNLERNAKADLVEAKEVREKAGDVSIAALLAPLDFVGAGSAASSGLLLAKNASRISKAVGDSVLRRFVSAASATKQFKIENGAQSDEIIQLLKAIEVAEPGSAKAIETENRLRLTINRVAEFHLGRKPTNEDEQAMSALAKGYLGAVDRPLTSVFTDYAEKTKTMSAPERKAFVERLKSITETGRGREVTAANGVDRSAASISDFAFQEDRARLALELAVEDGYQATAEIIKPGSGWTREAVRNLREVVTTARDYAKGSQEAVSVRFQKAISKITGQAEDSPHVKKLACCAGVVACSVAEREAEPEMNGIAINSVFMACVNR